MKIYTKTGDNGQSSLFEGTRVDKDNLRLEIYGELDELQVILGFCQKHDRSSLLTKELNLIIKSIFTLSTHIATENSNKLPAYLSDINPTDLEKIIDTLNKELPVLKNFIFPGPTNLNLYLNLARTKTRKIERLVTTLNKQLSLINQKLKPKIPIYLNRLSDLMFIMSRFANFKEGFSDKIWNEKNKKT